MRGLDCSLSGSQCVAGPLSAGCALDRCETPSGRTCLSNRAAHCAPPFLIGEDCGALDATCISHDGGATCQGHGAPCVVPRCDGQTLMACLGSHEARHPCGADETCQPAGQGITQAHCGIANECDPNTHFDLCQNGVLSYCRRGRRETLDCRALGLAGCQGTPASGCVTALADGGNSPPLTDAFLP